MTLTHALTHTLTHMLTHTLTHTLTPNPKPYPNPYPNPLSNYMGFCFIIIYLTKTILLLLELYDHIIQNINMRVLL